MVSTHGPVSARSFQLHTQAAASSVRYQVMSQAASTSAAPAPQQSNAPMRLPWAGVHVHPLLLCAPLQPTLTAASSRSALTCSAMAVSASTSACALQPCRRAVRADQLATTDTPSPLKRKRLAAAASTLLRLQSGGRGQHLSVTVRRQSVKCASMQPSQQVAEHVYSLQVRCALPIPADCSAHLACCICLASLAARLRMPLSRAWGVQARVMLRSLERTGDANRRTAGSDMEGVEHSALVDATSP